jgi:hypothetical protein
LIYLFQLESKVSPLKKKINSTATVQETNCFAQRVLRLGKKLQDSDIDTNSVTLNGANQKLKSSATKENDYEKELATVKVTL